ncbi:MAG: hypothetical protein CR977_01275 [Gammaproteobacteria bacterium]|nr:MAG: hypothetical protein CR977_01275 [Gammaproteobacteria bacterium]
MKKMILAACIAAVTQVLAAEVVLQKNYELEDMRKNHAMLRSFIEQQFDNKVMAAAIADELKNDKNYPIIRAMNMAKFDNSYYIKQKTLEKINAVKDFKTLAKQTYHSEIKKYQYPQTNDYYHILFIKQDNVDNKAKAESVLADIKAGRTTLADAAKQYHSAIAGTNDEGVLEKVQETQLMEPIQKAIFGMRVGDVSKVIETNAGYHIIGLKKVNDIETKPYDAELEQQIIAGLKTKMYRTVNKEIRDQYRGSEGLTVNDDLLKSVSDKILAPKTP